MDFASLMKSQISSASVAPADGEKKYSKRSEIEADRQAAYAREQAELERERLERAERKRQHEESEAERTAARVAKRKRLAEESGRVAEQERQEEEAKRRKRLGLPELAIVGAEGQDDGKDGESKVGKKCGEEGEAKDAKTATILSKGPIPTTLALLLEAEMRVPATVPPPDDLPARLLLRRQLASYFDMLLSAWQLALSQRAPEVQSSYAGKQAQSSFLAARDNLRPLFRKLETEGALSAALLTPIHEIVSLAQQKRYVHANDAYLRLSIGKAAWPIGVTMVGIHERSAREKLHEREKGGNQAHILADEVTRKMLQGIKRCLSFAQTRWPPDDLGQLMG